jgi:hypothetical protein
MTYEVNLLSGMSGRVDINTEIGKFWRDFTITDDTTVKFEDIDTLIDEEIVESHKYIETVIEHTDLTEIVLLDCAIQELLEENRFFERDCHHDYNDYYGVSRND